MTGLYHAGHSLIHRIPAGIKLILLCAIGIGLFFLRDWRLVLVMLATCILLYPVAQLPLRLLVRQLLAMSWFIILLGIIQWWADNWHSAIVVSGRLLSLLLLANLVTLTTRATDTLNTLSWALRWLRFLGVNPERISLMISLVLRFLPVIIEVMHEVRAAQKARGIEFNLIAMTVPVIIRTLKMADDIADAIDARQG